VTLTVSLPHSWALQRLSCFFLCCWSQPQVKEVQIASKGSQNFPMNRTNVDGKDHLSLSGGRKEAGGTVLTSAAVVVVIYHVGKNNDVDAYYRQFRSDRDKFRIGVGVGISPFITRCCHMCHSGPSLVSVPTFHLLPPFVSFDPPPLDTSLSFLGRHANP
jgi:hypothetical protein